MFLITSCTIICVTLSLFFTLTVLVDSMHRIRLDRVVTTSSPLHWFFSTLKGAVADLINGSKDCWGTKRGPVALDDDE